MRLNESVTQRNATRRWLVTAALIVPFAIAAFCARPAAADHTRFWRQSDYEEFQKGTPHGVALRSDGVVALAPKFATVADPNLAYLRSLRTDSHGNLYAAGGSNAEVLRIDAAGHMTKVFDSPELTAQALALDKSDNLYVATSPDGKIYKVMPSGAKSVFFDPKTKYIWDLVFAPDGTLYVATGDTGRIFEVSPDGSGNVFYASEQSHIRSLALDGKGNLIAGTEPDGWVMRIPLASDPPAAPKRSDPPKRGAAKQAGSPAPEKSGSGGAPEQSNTRKAYVLYQTPKREVTSIVADPAGNLYVSAIGDKRNVASASQPGQQTAQIAEVQGQVVTGTVTGGTSQQVLTAANLALFPRVTSSAVYRIAADGSPSEIWSASDEIVYALSLSPEGKLLLGVGNRGSVIEVDGDRVFSRPAYTESGQVTAFARAPNGKLFVATANPGKVVSLGPELESEGTMESQPFDAQIFSRWGRLNWWGKNGTAAAGNVQFFLRTGNTSDPSKNWSDWSGPYANGAEPNSPAARFAQWKAVLRASSGGAPEIAWVDLAYLPKNVAPQIEAIAIQNPGVRVTSFGGGQQTGTSTPSAQLHMPTTSESAQNRNQRTASERFEAPLQGAFQKGFQSVIWSAQDQNQDELTYSVYFRGENETNWRLLKDHLDQRFYSWDATTIPDGAYYLKIVASDAPSNPPGESLEGSRESERFIVDNTPPHIGDITAQVAPATNGATANIRLHATDSASPIIRALYSLDSGDWTTLRPVGQLSDSLTENYAFALPGLSPGEHTVSVRVFDQFENEATAKATFTVGGRGGR